MGGFSPAQGRGARVKALSLGMLVIAAIAVSALLDQDSGLSIWRELRRDLEVSQKRVELLVGEIDALQSEIATLESEPAALDRVIREELDLVLPGEVVVRFEPETDELAAVGSPPPALDSESEDGP